MNTDHRQRRRRRMDCRLAILIFILLLILPSLSWGVLRLFDRVDIIDMEKVDTDLGENRNKSELKIEPDNPGGALETYYNDRIPYRSVLITFDRNINSAVERPYNNMLNRLYDSSQVAGTTDDSAATDAVKVSATAGSDSPDIVETASVSLGNGKGIKSTQNKKDDDSASIAKSVEKKSKASDKSDNEGLEEESVVSGEEKEEDKLKQDPSYFPMRIMNELTILGRNNWLYYGKDTNRNNFVGNNLPDAATLLRYAGSVQAANDLCAARGKILRIMICPDKESIYPEYYPTVEIVSEYKKPQAIYDYLKTNTNASILYPKNELIANKGVCQLYYAYDSHWNYAGAYVGASSLLGSLGISCAPLSSISHPQTSAVIKDLVSIGNLNPADYTGDKDYLIDLNPGVTHTAINDILGTTHLMDYYTNAANSTYVVLIGDSYYGHMQSYITDTFSHFTFIHKDELDKDFVADYLKMADVIVLETVERNVDSVGTMADRVITALQ